MLTAQLKFSTVVINFYFVVVKAASRFIKNGFLLLKLLKKGWVLCAALMLTWHYLLK
jgi:hypothetical protein